MGHGGKRPGAGRKKKRLTDQSLAAKILARAEEEERWMELLKANDLRIRLDSLKYLTDRRDGRPVQKIANPEGEQFKIAVDVSSARNKLLTLLSGEVSPAAK